MTKQLLVLAIAGFCTFFSYGQKFDGGVMLGLVGSQVAGDLRSGYDKAGVNAGGWVSLGISPKSTLQMELAYIQKGSRENQDWDRGIEHTEIMRLGYIELPFLYKYLFNDYLILESGLGLNFLVHYAEIYDGEAIEIYRPFASQNLCFLAGISSKINKRLRINFRTDNSLFSIRKIKGTGDVWRFWNYGQFSDALILSVYYTL